MPEPSLAPGGPRRLAIVASYAPSFIVFRLQLLTEIRAAGHQVLCLAPDFDAGTVRTLRSAGFDTTTIKLDRRGLNPIADRATVRELTAAFQDWRPDVVTSYTSKPAIYATLAAAKAGIAHRVPMITGLGYAFHASRNPRAIAVRQVSKILYRKAFRVSTGAIFQNKDDPAVLRRLGVLPERLPITIVGGSGVDLDRFEAEPLPPFDGPTTFLMISRLVRYKGVPEYCEAARLAHERGSTARFLLIGPPETGPSGIPVAEIERYRPYVDYLGPRDDVRPHLRDAHVYVHPSYVEGMPRTVLEAMATGRPVITTDSNGCRDTVEPGVNGEIVPAGDVPALATAMQRLAAHPALLAPMGKASRRKVEQEYDVRIVNAAMRTALGLG